MQVCTSLQTDNHASTVLLCLLQVGCPSCHPTNSVKALKAIKVNQEVGTIFVRILKPVLWTKHDVWHLEACWRVKEEEKEKEREAKGDRVSDLKKDYTVSLSQLLLLLCAFSVCLIWLFVTVWCALRVSILCMFCCALHVGTYMEELV